MGESFDYLVIGGGSGGLASARRAASYGAKVGLVEGDRLGGTCVNRGCVPKKVMWNAAHLSEIMQDLPAYGFQAPMQGLDWSALVERREAYIRRLHGIYQKNLDTSGVSHLRGYGRLLDPTTVEVAGQTYHADKILLATGGFPHIPAIPGASLGITSDGFFALQKQPSRVAIVGAGYIAVELAGVLHALGSHVEVFLRYETVLRSFDSLLQTTLSEEMERTGIRLHRRSEIAEVSNSPNGLSLQCRSGQIYEGFDTLIWAIGRDPAVRGLGLERLAIVQDSQGHVEVNEWQETSVPGIYAVGDLTGKAQLTPVAIAAGRRLADRLFGGQPQAKLSYDLIPSVIFSHPPIGTVGLTEEEAHKRYHGQTIKAYTTRFVNMYYALTPRKPPTAMKLVTVGPHEEIVGAHVIGLGADEMIQGFAVAVHMKAKKSDLDGTLAIHPTAAEEFVTMR